MRKYSAVQKWHVKQADAWSDHLTDITVTDMNQAKKRAGALCTKLVTYNESAGEVGSWLYLGRSIRIAGL